MWVLHFLERFRTLSVESASSCFAHCLNMFQLLLILELWTWVSYRKVPSSWRKTAQWAFRSLCPQSTWLARHPFPYRRSQILDTQCRRKDIIPAPEIHKQNKQYCTHVTDVLRLQTFRDMMLLSSVSGSWRIEWTCAFIFKGQSVQREYVNPENQGTTIFLNFRVIWPCIFIVK